MPLEMKRLKRLEEENQRLKKLVAGLALDKKMLPLPSPALLLRPEGARFQGRHISG
jgi:hypothetical protein